MELFHYLNEIELTLSTVNQPETEYEAEKLKISMDFLVRRKENKKVFLLNIYQYWFNTPIFQMLLILYLLILVLFSIHCQPL